MVHESEEPIEAALYAHHVRCRRCCFTTAALCASSASVPNTHPCHAAHGSAQRAADCNGNCVANSKVCAGAATAISNHGQYADSCTGGNDVPGVAVEVLIAHHHLQIDECVCTSLYVTCDCTPHPI